jgi:hypothetical protein
MNGAGIELAAATAALLFINLRLLSFIGLLSLMVIRPYEPREHGANKKSPTTIAKAVAYGLPCLCSPDLLVEASVPIPFERRSVRSPRDEHLTAKTGPTHQTSYSSARDTRRKLLIRQDFAGHRVRVVMRIPGAIVAL